MEKDDKDDKDEDKDDEDSNHTPLPSSPAVSCSTTRSDDDKSDEKDKDDKDKDDKDDLSKDGDGKDPNKLYLSYPSASDINGRLRRVVTSYQRSNRKIEMRNEVKVMISWRPHIALEITNQNVITFRYLFLANISCEDLFHGVFHVLTMFARALITSWLIKSSVASEWPSTSESGSCDVPTTTKGGGAIESRLNFIAPSPHTAWSISG